MGRLAKVCTIILLLAISSYVAYDQIGKWRKRSLENAMEQGQEWQKKNEDLNALFIYLIAGAILGARLGHCFFYDPEYYLSNPLEIIKIWKGGLASHGGAIGISLAVWLYSRKRADQSFLWVADRVIIPIALAACFIRLGNLTNPKNTFTSI